MLMQQDFSNYAEHPGCWGELTDVSDPFSIPGFLGWGPWPESWQLISMHRDVCVLKKKLLSAASSPSPSAFGSLPPRGLMKQPQASVPLDSPLREYHSICLYWSTLDCRRYRNSGFGTANNQQQHQLMMHEKHLILTFPQFNLCQLLCLKGAGPWEQMGSLLHKERT